jgi:hypothetical protein
MVELAMAALHSHLEPPISLKQIDQLFYLHAVEFTTFLFLSRITFTPTGARLRTLIKVPRFTRVPVGRAVRAHSHG